MMIAMATAVSAAATPMPKSVMKKPSKWCGNSRRLKAAKLISTAFNINSTEMSLYGDEHRNQVTTADKAIHTDKEQKCAQHKIEFYWYHNLLLLLSCDCQTTNDTCQQEQRDELEGEHILESVGTNQCMTNDLHRHFGVGSVSSCE